jgi:hypothetical protein
MSARTSDDAITAVAARCRAGLRRRGSVLWRDKKYELDTNALREPELRDPGQQSICLPIG